MRLCQALSDRSFPIIEKSLINETISYDLAHSFAFALTASDNLEDNYFCHTSRYSIAVGNTLMCLIAEIVEASDQKLYGKCRKLFIVKSTVQKGATKCIFYFEFQQKPQQKRTKPKAKSGQKIMSSFFQQA